MLPHARRDLPNRARATTKQNANEKSVDIPATRLPSPLAYRLSAGGYSLVTLGRTVHASVTLRVTLGNAKSFGKHGVVTLVTPKSTPVCARTLTSSAIPSPPGISSLLQPLTTYSPLPFAVSGSSRGSERTFYTALSGAAAPPHHRSLRKQPENQTIPTWLNNDVRRSQKLVKGRETERVDFQN